MGIEYLASVAPPGALEVRTTERVAPLASDPTLRTVHDHQLLDNVPAWARASVAAIQAGQCEVPEPLHGGDLYLCPETQAALEGAVGATYDAVDAVCSAAGPKRAFAMVRPPGHHAYCGDPSGFCWVNNVICGAVYAAATHGIRHVAILDIDLHHGDGTQQLVRELTRRRVHPATDADKALPRLFYGSMHDVLSFPCEDGKEAKVRDRNSTHPDRASHSRGRGAAQVTEASVCVMDHHLAIWNVHLAPYTSKADFDRLYETKYKALLVQADAFFRARDRPTEDCLVRPSRLRDRHTHTHAHPYEEHRSWSVRALTRTRRSMRACSGTSGACRTISMRASPWTSLRYSICAPRVVVDAAVLTPWPRYAPCCEGGFIAGRDALQGPGGVAARRRVLAGGAVAGRLAPCGGAGRPARRRYRLQGKEDEGGPADG
jgi:acetoin utilization deacetylase AcuC-like enzyme